MEVKHYMGSMIMTPYNSSNTKKGRTSDTGEETTYDPALQGSLEYLNRMWLPFGIEGNKLTNEEFQSKTYDYYLKNNPDVLRKDGQYMVIQLKEKKKALVKIMILII